jgi:predicted acyltransferase
MNAILLIEDDLPLGTALARALPGMPALASLLCAVGFVLFWWVVAWALDRRGVYLKI